MCGVIKSLLSLHHNPRQHSFLYFAPEIKFAKPQKTQIRKLSIQHLKMVNVHPLHLMDY